MANDDMNEPVDDSIFYDKNLHVTDKKNAKYSQHYILDNGKWKTVLREI